MTLSTLPTLWVRNEKKGYQLLSRTGICLRGDAPWSRKPGLDRRRANDRFRKSEDVHFCSCLWLRGACSLICVALCGSPPVKPPFPFPQLNCQMAASSSQLLSTLFLETVSHAVSWSGSSVTPRILLAPLRCAGITGTHPCQLFFL